MPRRAMPWWMCGVLALAATGLGAQAAGNPAGNAENVNQRIADIINTTNNDEVQAGRMMQDRTQQSQIKDFCKMLIHDHQQQETKLRDVAAKQDLTLNYNARLQQDDQAEAAKLQSETEPSADRAFLAAEVTDHRQAIMQLQQMEPQITNPELKQYVRDAIPVLQKHLDAAAKIERQMGWPVPGVNPGS